MCKITAQAPQAIKSFNLKSKYCNIIKTSDFIKRKKKKGRAGKTYFGFGSRKLYV